MRTYSYVMFTKIIIFKNYSQCHVSRSFLILFMCQVVEMRKVNLDKWVKDCFCEKQFVCYIKIVMLSFQSYMIQKNRLNHYTIFPLYRIAIVAFHISYWICLFLVIILITLFHLILIIQHDYCLEKQLECSASESD